MTFLSDNRADLAGVRIPTLVLQCREDAIAPPAVGEYVHRAIPGSTLVVLDADRPLPQPQRARGDHRRDPRVPVTGVPRGERARALRARALRLPLHGSRRADRPRQPDVPRLDGLRGRRARRRAALPGPADGGRPDLPRDALRAAAADAGLGARDRRSTSGARTGAGCRCSSTRCYVRDEAGDAAARPHHDLRRHRPRSATSRSCGSRATASARRASGWSSSSA